MYLENAIDTKVMERRIARIFLKWQITSKLYAQLGQETLIHWPLKAVAFSPYNGREGIVIHFSLSGYAFNGDDDCW